MFQVLLSFTVKVDVKIGLLLVATGKYIKFIEPLIHSAEKYFLADQEIFYFVFTDGDLKESSHIIKINEKD